MYEFFVYLLDVDMISIRKFVYGFVVTIDGTPCEKVIIVCAGENFRNRRRR